MISDHSAIASANERMENIEKYDCNIPWAILMDPTAACNLKCAGGRASRAS